MMGLVRVLVSRNISHIAFVAPDNEFGRMISAYFGETFPGTVTFSELYTLGTKDFRDLLAKLIAQHGREGWISFQGYPGDIPAFIRQARELGFRGQFVTSLATTWPSTKRALDAMGESPVFMVPNVMLEENRSNKAGAFVTRFQEMTGEPPNWDAYYCYDVAVLLEEFSRDCEACTAAELRAFLRQQRLTGITGELRFDEKGQLATELVPAGLRFGNIIPWE